MLIRYLAVVLSSSCTGAAVRPFWRSVFLCSIFSCSSSPWNCLWWCSFCVIHSFFFLTAAFLCLLCFHSPHSSFSFVFHRLPLFSFSSLSHRQFLLISLSSQWALKEKRKLRIQDEDSKTEAEGIWRENLLVSEFFQQSFAMIFRLASYDSQMTPSPSLRWLCLRTVIQ